MLTICSHSPCMRQVCGSSSVVSEGVRLLRPGGTYVLVGMVHPNSQLNLTGEQIIRKCLTIRGEPIREGIQAGLSTDACWDPHARTDMQRSARRRACTCMNAHALHVAVTNARRDAYRHSFDAYSRTGTRTQLTDADTREHASYKPIGARGFTLHSTGSACKHVRPLEITCVVCPHAKPFFDFLSHVHFTGVQSESPLSQAPPPSCSQPPPPFLPIPSLSKTHLVPALQPPDSCCAHAGVHNYAPRHLHRALEFLARTVDAYPYAELVSPLYKLQDIATALEVARQQNYFRVCLAP